MSLLTAIKNTIFDTVLSAYADTSGDPSLSPYQNQEVIVGQIWPSQIIDENQYGNAWSPTNPMGVMAATENLSMLVDPIPNISEWYTKSGRKVEEMYEFMITGATATSPTTEKSIMLRGATASSVARTNTNSRLKSVASELIERKEVEVRLPDSSKIKTVALTPEATKKKELEIAHSNAAAAVLAHERAHKKATRTATPNTRGAQAEVHSAFDQSRKQAWKALNTAKASVSKDTENQKSIVSVDTSFHEANLLFSRSTLASVRNPGVAYHPSYTSPENWVSANAKNNWPLLTIPVENTDPPVDLTITFSRVDITRPWLVASLFELDGWKTPQGAGSLSTGTVTNNKGNFSLLPQSMIVARDIIARTSTSTVYRASGLQVLAYISTLVPYAPPE